MHGVRYSVQSGNANNNLICFFFPIVSLTLNMNRLLTLAKVKHKQIVNSSRIIKHRDKNEVNRGQQNQSNKYEISSFLPKASVAIPVAELTTQPESRRYSILQ